MDLKSLQKLKTKILLKKFILKHKLKKKTTIKKLNLVQKNKPNLILLQSVQNGYLFDYELIAFFKYIIKKKNIKKRLYVKCYPFLPITKKPAEVRMGKGKGKIDSYCKPIATGSVLAEIRLTKKLAKKKSYCLNCAKILTQAAKKFKLKTKIINHDF